MMTPQLLTDFQSMLRASIDVAETFSDLLIKEKKQLTSTDRQEVVQLLEQKQTLIQQLATHQQNILSFCKTYGIEPTYSALRSFLYGIGEKNTEAVLKDWTILKNTLIKNQALNKTNEAILNELIRRNQIKQSIIQNLGRKSDTYAANGQQSSKAQHGWVEQV